MSAISPELRQKIAAAFPESPMTQDIIATFYDRSRFTRGQRSLTGVAKELGSDRATVAVHLAPLFEAGLFNRSLTGPVGGEKVLYYVLEREMDAKLNPPANVRFARVPYLPADLEIPSSDTAVPLQITGIAAVDAHLDPIVQRRYHPVTGYLVMLQVDVMVTCNTVADAPTYRIAHTLKVRFNNADEHNILSAELVSDGNEDVDNPATRTDSWATAIEDYLITRAISLIVDADKFVNDLFDFDPAPFSGDSDGDDSDGETGGQSADADGGN